MSITTYGELKTAIANYLSRSDLTDRIPEFISMAEDRIAQELRIRPMETSTDLTISSQETALPTRYVEARRLFLDTNPKTRLEFMAPHIFWSKWGGSQTGKPRFFTIEGENIVVGPAPDQTQTGKFLYYQRFAALSSDSDTNWLLTNARGLLLYASLAEAALYIKDDSRLTTWAAMYEEIRDRVIAADIRDRASGDSLQVRPDFDTP